MTVWQLVVMTPLLLRLHSKMTVVAPAAAVIMQTQFARYVCPLAGRLWTAFKDRTFSPLLQRCLTVIFSTLIVVLEMDFLFRPL